MARTIHVNAGGGYDVVAGSGLLKQVGSMVSNVIWAKKIAIFTDSTVEPIYGEVVKNSLEEAGFWVDTFVYPAGEQYKRIDVVASFLDFMSERHFTRKDAVLCLGGGVAGDMGGFAAAIYQRGIKFIQVPTTLLAAVDSSVGGKTGVDTAYGKNLTGAFWQPSLVVYDTDTFDTLQEDQILDGTAEIIKTACIRDAKLFDGLEQMDLRRDLEDIVARCVEIKGEVVEIDEKESGLRRILNFGHTLGHAIELKMNYGISHGKAVAIGMLIVTKASEKQGITEAGTYERLFKLISERGFRTETEIPLAELVEAARSDKKSQGDAINIIYIGKIGEAADRTIAYDELLEFFK